MLAPVSNVRTYAPEVSPQLRKFWEACRSGIPMELSVPPDGPDRAGSIPCFVRLDEPTGRLLVHFARRAPGVRDLTFPEGHFAVNTKYSLPKEVGFRSGGTCWVEPGRYPVLSCDNFLTVSLRLSVED